MAIFEPDPRRLLVGVALGLVLCVCGISFSWFGFSRNTSHLSHPELERWGTIGIGGIIVLVGVCLLVWLRQHGDFACLFVPGG